METIFGLIGLAICGLVYYITSELSKKRIRDRNEMFEQKRKEQQEEMVKREEARIEAKKIKEEMKRLLAEAQAKQEEDERKKEYEELKYKLRLQEKMEKLAEEGRTPSEIVEEITGQFRTEKEINERVLKWDNMRDRRK